MTHPTSDKHFVFFTVPTEADLFYLSEEQHLGIINCFRELTEWLCLVAFHTRNGSQENQSVLASLVQRIPTLPLEPSNDKLQRLIDQVKHAAERQIFDKSLNQKTSQVLNELSEKFPNFVSFPTPESAQGSAPSPFSFSPQKALRLRELSSPTIFRFPPLKTPPPSVVSSP